MLQELVIFVLGVEIGSLSAGLPSKVIIINDTPVQTFSASSSELAKLSICELDVLAWNNGVERDHPYHSSCLGWCQVIHSSGQEGLSMLPVYAAYHAGSDGAALQKDTRDAGARPTTVTDWNKLKKRE